MWYTVHFCSVQFPRVCESTQVSDPSFRAVVNVHRVGSDATVGRSHHQSWQTAS